MYRTTVSLAMLVCLIAANVHGQGQAKPRDPVDELAARLEPTRIIAYKQVGDRPLHLHIFEPPEFRPSDRRACFVVIHGGGWTGGTARRMYPFAAHYAERGLVGISIEYRLLKRESGTTVFDCVEDGRSAVRYVRTHAAELGIDPEKIIVSGGSAGGHVGVETALFDEVHAEQDREVSSTPNALVLLFPVIDTSPDGYGNAKIGPRWRELSPVHQVREKLPPTITFHGTGDTVTPFGGAKAFHEAMLKAGNRSELVVHEGGRHGYLMFDRQLYLETLNKTDEFLASLGMLTDKAN